LKITAAIAVVGCGGCGYRTAGHFSTMPKNVHVIAVPAMENKTSTYRVEQKLTAATIHELLVKTNYHVVSDANGVMVLTVVDDHISKLTRFGGRATIARFGLPLTLPDAL